MALVLWGLGLNMDEFRVQDAEVGMGNMGRFKRGLGCGVALLLLLRAGLLSAETIHVAVASNFTQTMRELVQAFSADSEHEVRLSFGASGTFHAQISNGAPFALLFSADRAVPERLEQEGRIVPGSRFTYARGRLVLWSADPQLVEEGGAILARGGFRRLALANPALAPYGRAAVQVLAVLDPGGALREHLVQGENVGQTFQFVSTANAELGFVALSQVRQPGSDGWRAGSAWLIPETLHDPIEQDVVWLKQAENSKAVPALLDFIRSPEGRAIIVAHGYEPGFDDQ